MQAFDNNGAIAGWEAGQKLLDRVSDTLKTSDQTFAQVASAGLIARRIFTSARNGVAPGNVMLWNSLGPDAAVAPDSYSTAGSLDGALFLKGDGTRMDITDLQATPLFACLGSNLPAPCASATASTKLAAARREAREMILAYTAGAEAVRDGNGHPVRSAAGEIVYRARPWILADSSLASPAVITPPLAKVPVVHQAEYLLFRDGPRRAATGEALDALDQGFGLRNPDGDGREVPVGSQQRVGLKPVMSVVYMPANDMLHALRAGAQCPTLAVNASCTGTETGGEELWGYVPYDQLPKLRDRLEPQTRVDHTFMLASSLRFGDVFVPGAFTLEGNSYSGRWRRVLLMGRGIGGRFYSALDVTSPGPFTRSSLSTSLPSVLWARGNPDTADGTAGGARNGTRTEEVLYGDMGQTWSTPALARTDVFAGDPEFVAYVGSGYGTSPNEGTRFYTLDALSGSILASVDVGDAAGASLDNAIVADPATYAADLLVPGVDLPHPSGPAPTAVYVGDIHGRMWKFKTASTADLQTSLLFKDVGIAHPIGVAAALLNLGNPFVFFTTGHDARLAAPPSQFEMWAVEDEDRLPGTTVPGFPVRFPAPGPGTGAYRGTVPPLTAYQGTEGVVFFVGTRFNPVSAGRCVSTFDSIVFALFAKDASAAYDWAEYQGAKIVGLPMPPVPPAVPGSVPADVANPAPGGSGPPPPPVPEPEVGAPAVVVTQTLRPSSSVCRF